MELVYAAFVRLPTPRAHGLQIMKMCESFARAGAAVTLAVPQKALRGSDADPFAYYEVERNFRIDRIWSTDLLGFSYAFGALFYAVDLLTFVLSLARMRLSQGTIVYVRDPILLLAISRRATAVVELHDIRDGALFWKMIRRADRVVVITEGLKRALMERGIEEQAIIVAPDGVDLKDFAQLPDRGSIRRDLAFPEGPVALYTGHLYEWKGAGTLARAAAAIPDVTLMFVGGIGAELAAFQKDYGESSNVRIIPMQPHALVPRYLVAADVLVLPNSGKERISSHYTSPLKLFEYMAAGRPIVASDLPSIREVLSEKNAYLVPPDSPDALAAGIRAALSDTSRAEDARTDAERYTWQRRAASILGSIKPRLSRA